MHPYPAMIADAVADELAEEFIQPGQHVLDPFCGTSRTLVATAARGADGVGIDTNPLAVLVSRAKFSNPRTSQLKSLTHDAKDLSFSPSNVREFEAGRSVSFFSPAVRGQLNALIDLINSSDLTHASALWAAACLSATARDASVCRKSSWKLHRMPASERRARRVDARELFARRLETMIDAEDSENRPSGNVKIARGNAMSLGKVIDRISSAPTEFDLIFTSPPYGDSFSTVQYGGISSICLGVVSHLRRPRLQAVSGAAIDGDCLGGSRRANSREAEADFDRSIWNGSRESRAWPRVRNFLSDMRVVCAEAAPKVRSGGRVVMVVGRRSVDGWRVHFDRFLAEEFESLGFVHEETRRRRVVHKWTPWTINATGASSDQASPRLTMQWEYVVVLRRP